MITDELLHFVEGEEKCVLHPYLDPIGLPTIGWGHRIQTLDHPDLTQPEADQLLRDDLTVAEHIALALSPTLAQATPRRQAAIIDFCFNAGGGHYGTSTLRKCVDAGDWVGASDQIERWVYGHDRAGNLVKLPGLVKRRAQCAAWLASG